MAVSRFESVGAVSGLRINELALHEELSNNAKLIGGLIHSQEVVKYTFSVPCAGFLLLNLHYLLIIR